MNKKLIIVTLVLAMYSGTSSAKYTFFDFMDDNCGGGCSAGGFAEMGEEIAEEVIKFGLSVSNAILAAGATVAETIQMMAAQKTADMKQRNTVNKALTEASENYDKTIRFQENAVSVEMDKGSSDFQSNDMVKGCEMLLIASNNIKKQDIVRSYNSKSQDKAIKAGTTLRDIQSEQRAIEKTHKELFCSRQDVERGYCAKEAGGDMQDLDRHSTNIFAPNEDGMTYSKEQLIAANNYMDGVINSVNEPALSEQMEKTPAGQIYQQKLMAQQRITNASALSLKRIINIRSSQEGK